MKMHLLLLLLLSLFLVSVSSRPLTDAWEDEFLKVPNPSRAYSWHSVLTSTPHVAGTKEDYQTALYTLNTLKSFGLNATIQEEEVLLSYPVERSVKAYLSDGSTFDCPLEEDPVGSDPNSRDPRVIPTFLAYSPSGNVTAEVVYVNYGSIEDYALLEEKGISVEGKIVIARYGSIFRGVKVMIAEEKGAIGILIYSDPIDDGFNKGKVYPEGPWKPSTAVQRGSIQFLSICGGNPLSKWCGNTTNVPSIPAIPLSYADATPILSDISSNEAPSSWQGGLNFTYNIGPGPVKVALRTNMNNKVGTIWNVVAEIKGTEEPHKKVIIGNHRDAWTFGAADPNSGTATLFELARGLATLQSKGWAPRRTIVICSWDGEEYGLLGSTAFAERYENDLSQNGIAYLNVDVGVTGRTLKVKSTPSLKRLIKQVAEVVIDPETKTPLSQVWDGNVSILGSGSDFTAFLDHLGIPSLDLSFSGPYGVYHTLYDDITWMKNFGAASTENSPSYQYYVAMAQLWGLITMRLADSAQLPLNYQDYSQVLDDLFTQAEELVKKEGGENKVNLDAFKESLSDFATAAMNFPCPSSNINDKLQKTERFFLGDGLPKRPFYRHLVQAPGLYLGYGADTFPGLTEAAQAHDWATAQNQTDILASHFSQAAAFLCPNLK